MCVHSESTASLRMLRLKAGSLPRSLSSSNNRVRARACVFWRLFPPPHNPASAPSNPSGRPKVPTPRRGGQVPEGPALGLSKHCVDPLPLHPSALH